MSEQLAEFDEMIANDPQIEEQMDGSVLIGDVPPDTDTPDTTEWYENLIDKISEDDLKELKNKLPDLINGDKNSRAKWFDLYEKGLKIAEPDTEKDKERTDRGLSSVSHPLLIEAAMQFQARAIGELFPPGGPVSSKIVGDADEETLAQADRVKNHMNYQVTEEMEEYFPDMDQMLFHLPLVGQTFKKSWYDPILGRNSSRFVEAENFIVHHGTKDLYSCRRYTHVIRLEQDEFLALVHADYYKDIKPQADAPEPTTVEKITGEETDVSTDEESYVLWECHTFRHIKSLEESETAAPYIITLDSVSEEITSVRRNWKQGDELNRKRTWFTSYKFLPGLGFYGFGLFHAIGGLGEAATGALRALLDAANFANLQGGLKLKGRTPAGDIEISPGEFVDIDSTVDDVNKAVMPLPFKEPSNTLFLLLGFMVESGQRFANISELAVGEANNNAPVGTTVALLEQGSRVFSAVHKRLHNSQRQEFKLLAELNSEFLPEDEYPYKVHNATRKIFKADYDERVDIIPISDPNIYSSSQRIVQAQTSLQLAQANPEIHDLRAAYKRMYQALRVPNYEELLPDPLDIPRLDAVTENTALMLGKEIKVFEDQDHLAHISVLDDWFKKVPPQMQKMMLPKYIGHRSGHMGYYYRAVVQEQMSSPLPHIPAMPEKNDHIEPVPIAEDHLISQAAAHLMQQNPGGPLGPPIPNIQGDKKEGGDEAQAIAAKAQAEAKAVEVKTQATIAADTAKAQLKMQIMEFEAQLESQIKTQEMQLASEINMLELQFKHQADAAKLGAEITAKRERASTEIQIARERADQQIEEAKTRMQVDAIVKVRGAERNE